MDVSFIPYLVIITSEVLSRETKPDKEIKGM